MISLAVIKRCDVAAAFCREYPWHHSETHSSHPAMSIALQSWQTPMPGMAVWAAKSW